MSQELRSADEVRKLLLIGLEPEEEPPMPSGEYICGCPWAGYVIPHFCPVHPDAYPIFEIREPRS
jgi:hypothetical protein